MNNNHILADSHIGRLLIKLSLPATIGMLVMALYNIVDTIFVGHGVGSLAIAGLTIVFPIQMIVMAVAMMVGMGAASIISRALGANDIARANQTLGNVLLIVVSLGIVVAVGGNLCIDVLLKIFGATPAILPYARDYARIILAGTMLFAFAMTANAVVRAEGRATIAMTTMIVSSVLNIILDAVFIFGFGWGIRGAAVATVVSQLTTDLYLLGFFVRGKGSLKICRVGFRPNFKIIREMVAVGSSAFVRQISGSLIAVIVNNTLKFYGGELSIAVYGIVNRILMFVFMPIFGIAQGVQPIVGYNYGARRYAQALRVLHLGIVCTTLIAVAGAFYLEIFPAQIFSFFTNDQQLITLGVRAIRIINIGTALIGFQVIATTLFQSLGMARKALYLTVARQLVLIPLVIFLPIPFQLNGVWCAFPLSDLLFFFVSWGMYRPQVHNLKKMHLHPELSVIAEHEVTPSAHFNRI